MSSYPEPSSNPPKQEMVYFPRMSQPPPPEYRQFRRVLWTGLYSQVVLMTVPVNGDIGEEACTPTLKHQLHDHANLVDQTHTVDQILTFTSGTGLAQVGGKEQEVKAGDMVIVPANTKHQFLNTGNDPLTLYTVYSPAEHATKTVHLSKEEGEKEEENGIDVPPKWSQLSKSENEKAVQL